MWLERVETLIKEQEAEQKALRRSDVQKDLAKASREAEIRKTWDTYEYADVQNLIEMWRKLEIDDILSDVRDIAWPESDASFLQGGTLTLVLPLEDAEIEISRTARAAKITGRVLPQIRTSWGSGIWTKGKNASVRAVSEGEHHIEGRGHKLADAMATSGVDPRDIKNPHFKATISHIEPTFPRYSRTNTDFSLCLYEDRIVIGEEQIPLDNINSGKLKDKMVPILVRIVSKI